MKIGNLEAAKIFATGGTVDRVKLKCLKSIIIELDLIIDNCNTVKRQLKKAIKNEGL